MQYKVLKEEALKSLNEEDLSRWPKDDDMEGWARFGKAFPNMEIQKNTHKEHGKHCDETISFVQHKIGELAIKYKGQPVEEDLNKLFRYISHRGGATIGGGLFPVENPYES